MNNSKSVEISSQVIDIQIDAINKLKKSINKDFDEIIAHLSKIKGRIIVTGIGKSAIIGMKISSTLNSTGSPSIFMHGSDALHGDLGTITKDDTLIYLSKSGNNSDTIELINNLNKRKIDVIAITANKDSYLGKNSKSRIVSKGISAGFAQNTYRGLVSMHPKAKNSRNYTQCDSLLIGDKCGAHTVPYIEVKNNSSRVEHEATTSKVDDDQLFYCRQRGMDEEEAVALVVNGFCKDVLQALPMEFAMEAQQLVAISLEGSVG